MEKLHHEQFRSKDSYYSNTSQNSFNDDNNYYNQNREEQIKILEKNNKFSEEETKIRNEYLKHYNKKEIFLRSLKLGRKNLTIKIIQYICSVYLQIAGFKMNDYNSKMINIFYEKKFELFSDYFFPYTYLFLSTMLVKDIDFYLANKLKDVSQENVLLENFLKKDMEFFDVFKTGELCDKANYYGAYPFYDIIETCLTFIRNIATFFYSGYYLYKNFFYMALISTIFFLAEFFIDPYVNNKVDLEGMNERYNFKNDILNEIISNIRLIKSFCTEEKELKKLYLITSKLRKDSLLFYFLKGFGDHLSSISSLLIFYISGKKSCKGEMQYSDLITFEKYMGEFTNCLKTFKYLVTSTLYGILEWKKFLEFYDIEPKIISKENAIIPTENKNNEKFHLKFENVDFNYPTKKNVIIFKNLNFDITSGKIVAFVGASGSGKTTITSLIQRFYDPIKGEIKINSINLKNLDLKWLRKNIGIVSQEPILKSGTIKENILYGVDSYTENYFNEICKLSSVDLFVENKNFFPNSYNTIIGERGVTLSGGQKQKIAIARALMKNSKILIFDEATSALDSESEAIVHKNIFDLVKNKGITTIFIAHRLSTIKNVDCIYVLKDGDICEKGTHQELMDMNGYYKFLIQKQIV